MNLNKFAPYVLALLRIATGYTFVLHATIKLFNWPVAFPYPLSNLFLAAGIIELIFGILFILGLFTRFAAFILSGTMAVAYFMVHFSLFPMANGGEPAYLFCFIFFYFVFSGAGAFALDDKVGKKIKI